MQRIKVLHIIKTLNVGGAESNLLTLTRSLNPKVFEIHVAYSSKGELEERFQQAGIKLFKFASQAHKLKSFVTLVSLWRLVSYIQKEKIDIIHTHTFNAHVLGSMAAKLTGCRIIEHVHDSRYMDPEDFRRRGETNKQFWAVKYLKNLSDYVVVLTRQNYDFVIKNKLHAEPRVREIQNGIDLNSSCFLSEIEKITLKNHLGIAWNAPVVLTPIRFSPEKNLDVLFQIALDVIALVPQAVCLIPGNGPEKAKFEEKATLLGLQSKIKTIGFYPDIPQLLAISDVFLLPSTIELHSIAIMEAMLQKVPVVVSRNVGCNNEFIRDGSNGYLLDPFCKYGWGEIIALLLKDNDLRTRIGEAGHDTVARRFDIQHIARKFESLYAELASF